jgi:hypothetical protein
VLCSADSEGHAGYAQSNAKRAAGLQISTRETHRHLLRGHVALRADAGSEAPMGARLADVGDLIARYAKVDDL